MEATFQARAAGGRSRTSFGGRVESPSIDPSAAEWADNGQRFAGDCPEFDCVRTLLAQSVIDDAECRAAALGIGVGRVLIAAGELSEEVYLGALGVACEPLDRTLRHCCPLNDERLIESAAAGAHYVGNLIDRFSLLFHFGDLDTGASAVHGGIGIP
jgi:hypothetical protein